MGKEGEEGREEEVNCHAQFCLFLLPFWCIKLNIKQP